MQNKYIILTFNYSKGSTKTCGHKDEKHFRDLCFDLNLREILHDIELFFKVTAIFTFRHSYGQILAKLGQVNKNDCPMLDLKELC